MKQEIKEVVMENCDFWKKVTASSTLQPFAINQHSKARKKNPTKMSINVAKSDQFEN